MNNCLVTKLKTAVNNDNLDIYGVTKLRVGTNISTVFFHFRAEDDSEATMTLESNDDNAYFKTYNGTRLGKTITAVKNQAINNIDNAFYVVAEPGTVVTIKDMYNDKVHYTFDPFYQYRESLEQDIKWRQLSEIRIHQPELVCNVKQLIKANNNAPFNIDLLGSKNVVYDDMKVVAYCMPVTKTEIQYGNFLLSTQVKTILSKRDIMQIIAVRRYLGITNGSAEFSYPESAYLGDKPLSSFGSFVWIKFVWTADTVTVYTAGNDKNYVSKATISNSDKYDLE